MPTYEYQCPKHGRRNIVKEMRFASDPVWCVECASENIARGNFEREEPMRRVYTAPAMIMRPHGYHLKPGEPGYWDIGRALEVGHVPTPDAKSNLGAGAPKVDDLVDDTPDVEIDDAALRKLNEAVVATYGEPGDAEAARVWHEARTNGYGVEAGA